MTVSQSSGFALTGVKGFGVYYFLGFGEHGFKIKTSVDTGFV